MPDEKIGPTGRNVGQLGPHDKGELACRIAIEQGFIVLQFGAAVTWLSIGASGARGLALLLLAKADELDRKLTL
jgi:hypothetical protein